MGNSELCSLVMGFAEDARVAVRRADLRGMWEAEELAI